MGSGPEGGFVAVVTSFGCWGWATFGGRLCGCVVCAGGSLDLAGFSAGSGSVFGSNSDVLLVEMFSELAMVKESVSPKTAHVDIHTLGFGR
jgi:hypothetical protein